MTYIPSRDEVESALAKASSIDPLACEVRRLREESNAAGWVLSGIDEMMTSFKNVHSVGYGPNNAEFERLFESILDVLNQVRP